jgi:hypothetical protein
MAKHTGISNRQSAEREADERREHRRPPAGPAPEDAAGHRGDASKLEELEAEVPGEGHTSHKAGTRSSAQKEADSRHPRDPQPASRKQPGALGKE